MKRLLNVSYLALIASFSISAEQDSSASVVSNITQSDTFSSAGNNVVRLYQGGTTGNVALQSGYDHYYVNGLYFKKGIGATVSGYLQPRSIAVESCISDSYQDNHSCSASEKVVTIPGCTWQISDSGAKGCQGSIRVVPTYCVSSRCNSRPAQTHRQSYTINSVVGVK